MTYSICGTDTNKKSYLHEGAYNTLEEAREAAKSFFRLFRDGADIEHVDILEASGVVVETYSYANVIAGD